MVDADYVVVGSGLTGATIARCLSDAGFSVIVVERREHVGGNAYDWVHASGIRVHAFGPHYFRTSSPAIWDYVNRFSTFYPYEASICSLVDGRYERWPVTRSYVERVAGASWRPPVTASAANFEEACLAMMPRAVYKKFVRGYTEKQWGVPAKSLSAELAGRFDVRADDDARLSRHRYQGIPEVGYAEFMRRMLDGIPVELGHAYDSRARSPIARKRLVFTGPIDEYYDFRFGRLAYRGQRRLHEYHEDEQSVQPCGQVNNPDPANGAHIRTLEWKHMMAPAAAAQVKGTLVTRETPYTPLDPVDYEYPFPDEANRRLYERYRAWAQADPRVLFCGRLGEYRYLDMDQAIARAFLMAKRLLDAEGRISTSPNALVRR